MIRNQLFSIFVLLLFYHNTAAQSSFDSSFHFYYYDQKLSMFEQMPTPPNSIVWLGDSITDGGEWSELFPQYNTLNRGISADNTFGVLHRLQEVIRRKPNKLFLMIGINDISRTIPDEIILRNYRRIIEQVQEQSPSTQIYVQSILPTNHLFTQFPNHQNKTAHIIYINQALRILCREKQISYINLYDSFTDSNGNLDQRYTNDGLHLTGEGYLRWKEILTIEKIL